MPYTRSIRHRLLLILVPMIFFVWSVATLLILWDAKHEIEELFDANLAQSARVLSGLLSHEVQEGKFDEIKLMETVGRVSHRYERKIAVIARYGDGRSLLRSDSAPHLPPMEEGFSDFTMDNGRWRVFTLVDPVNGLRIQTAELYSIRNELVAYLTRDTSASLLLLLPILATLVWISTGQSLRPLRRIALEVERRAADSLEPVPTTDIPLEIVTLIHALNNLFRRLERAMCLEKRFTADAAHELRTPLAALKVQAQVALGTSDDTQRRLALNNILTGVDRATHLTDQLLTLARIDHLSPGSGEEKLDLARIVQTAFLDMKPQATARNIDFILNLPVGTCGVLGNPDTLKILLRNLFDNALRYTPPTGMVAVTIENQADRITLRVIDSGPGIAESEREYVQKRFHRGRQTEAPGSGLGLSIVRRIADLHRASLELADAAGASGLAVTVIFPASA